MSSRRESSDFSESSIKSSVNFHGCGDLSQRGSISPDFVLNTKTADANFAHRDYVSCRYSEWFPEKNADNNNWSMSKNGDNNIVKPDCPSECNSGMKMEKTMKDIGVFGMAPGADNNIKQSKAAGGIGIRIEENGANSFIKKDANKECEKPYSFEILCKSNMVVDKKLAYGTECGGNKTNKSLENSMYEKNVHKKGGSMDSGKTNCMSNKWVENRQDGNCVFITKKKHDDDISSGGSEMSIFENGISFFLYL